MIKIMKAKFMNFVDRLSRDEMRTITGGYKGYGDDGPRDGSCYSDLSCSLEECAEVNGRLVAFWACEGGVGCVDTNAYYCLA